jgi:hypothetical protein
MAPRTALGKRFSSLLQEATDLIVGRVTAPDDAWERLDRAFAILECADVSDSARQLAEACAEAMLAAGIEQRWVDADFDNIEELLRGDLGPVP